MKQICKIVAFFEDLAHERFLTALIVRAGRKLMCPWKFKLAVLPTAVACGKS